MSRPPSRNLSGLELPPIRVPMPGGAAWGKRQSPATALP